VIEVKCRDRRCREKATTLQSPPPMREKERNEDGFKVDVSIFPTLPSGGVWEVAGYKPTIGLGLQLGPPGLLPEGQVGANADRSRPTSLPSSLHNNPNTNEKHSNGAPLPEK
jgi:hypothetical protein